MVDPNTVRKIDVDSRRKPDLGTEVIPQAALNDVADMRRPKSQVGIGRGSTDENEKHETNKPKTAASRQTSKLELT